MILYCKGWGSLYPANNTFSSLCNCLLIKQNPIINSIKPTFQISKGSYIHAQDVSNGMFLSFDSKRRRIYDLCISIIWNPEEREGKRQRLRKLLCFREGGRVNEITFWSLLGRRNARIGRGHSWLLVSFFWSFFAVMEVEAASAREKWRRRISSVFFFFCALFVLISLQDTYVTTSFCSKTAFFSPSYFAVFFGTLIYLSKRFLMVWKIEKQLINKNKN